MNDMFNDWILIPDLPMEKVIESILTNRTIETFNPDCGIYTFIGNKETPISVLDFGCGIGRNTFGLGLHSPRWTITGYDNSGMIKLTDQYYTMKYKIPHLLTNVSFSDDWESLKKLKFDVVLCCYVLQHIYEKDLFSYIEDFKNITNHLIVLGRRSNDDISERSTWTILEEAGLIPTSFYRSGGMETNYSPEGDIYEHNIAVYNFE